MNLQEGQYLSRSCLIRILQEIKPGYRKPADAIFSEGNKLIKPFVKTGISSIDEEELHLKDSIICNVPNCRQMFQTVFAYQTHYNALHRYNCSQCKKNLPSSHLLDLHISEQHDSFFSVQADRQPMYSCFLEECKHKSASSKERRDHCIRAHRFPHNFRFDMPTPPIEKELPSTTSGEIGRTIEASELSSKTPKYFTFGGTQAKVFNFKDKSYARSLAGKEISEEKMDTNALEDMQVSDLMDSLPT